MCSGKVYHDIMEEVDRRGGERPAITRVEQLYPFPENELRQTFAGMGALAEVVWVQEEPRNMGAWTFIEPRLRAVLGDQVTLRYVGRPERASPAEGYPAAHKLEQARIVNEALGE